MCSTTCSIDNGKHRLSTDITRTGHKVHVRNFSPHATTISELCNEMAHDIRDRSGGRNGQRITFHSQEAAKTFTRQLSQS